VTVAARAIYERELLSVPDWKKMQK